MWVTRLVLRCNFGSVVAGVSDVLSLPHYPLDHLYAIVIDLCIT